jgi:hypothetical protein
LKHSEYSEVRIVLQNGGAQRSKVSKLQKHHINANFSNSFIIPGSTRRGPWFPGSHNASYSFCINGNDNEYKIWSSPNQAASQRQQSRHLYQIYK